MEYKVRTSVLQIGLVFAIFLDSSSATKKIRGFGFQKEHDGSIVGIEDSNQQIHLQGAFCFLRFYRLHLRYAVQYLNQLINYCLFNRNLF